MTSPSHLIPTLAVFGVAAAALATAWFTMQPAVPDSGRPGRPLEAQVVRAPSLTQPDTSVVGGPPAPSGPRAPRTVAAQ